MIILITNYSQIPYFHFNPINLLILRLNLCFGFNITLIITTIFNLILIKNEQHLMLLLSSYLQYLPFINLAICFIYDQTSHDIFRSIAEHQKQHLLTSAWFHSILQLIKEFQFQPSVTIDEFNLQAHELILFIVIIFLSNHLELNFKIINPITLNTALLPFLAAFSTIHCHFITTVSLI